MEDDKSDGQAATAPMRCTAEPALLFMEKSISSEANLGLFLSPHRIGGGLFQTH